MSDLIGKTVCTWCCEIDPTENHKLNCPGTFKPKKYKYGWVSVKDKLPKEYTDVLAFGNEGIIIAQYYGEDLGGWGTTMNKSSDHITHWQPLPEPPK